MLGVFSGVQVSRRLRKKTPRADPYVCATGLLLSAPFLYLAIVFAQGSTAATYVSSERTQRVLVLVSLVVSMDLMNVSVSNY